MSVEIKKDVYQRITDQVISALDAGIKPWEKGYEGGGLPLPVRSTGERYNGINIVSLWCEMLSKGYSQPRWITYKQAQAMGGNVKKGEHGSCIAYYGSAPKKGEPEDVEEKFYRFAKGFTVFNVEQCEGLPEELYRKPPERTEHERIECAEAFIKATGARIEHEPNGQTPCYVPLKDYIRMPDMALYNTPEKYYTTVFHELTHLSGAPHRLDRLKDRKENGKEGIAFEELIAELGSAFIAAGIGMKLESLDNHISYISSWLEILKKDKKFIFQAASAAQKAVNFLNQNIQQEAK